MTYFILLLKWEDHFLKRQDPPSHLFSISVCFLLQSPTPIPLHMSTQIPLKVCSCRQVHFAYSQMKFYGSNPYTWINCPPLNVALSLADNHVTKRLQQETWMWLNPWCQISVTVTVAFVEVNAGDWAGTLTHLPCTHRVKGLRQLSGGDCHSVQEIRAWVDSDPALQSVCAILVFFIIKNDRKK